MLNEVKHLYNIDSSLTLRMTVCIIVIFNVLLTLQNYIVSAT